MTLSDQHPPAQSPRAQLGDDELRAVFDFAANDSIDHKFALSQVSVHWRCVALSVSAFWASFAIKSPLDAFRFHTVIERAAPALLDVSLDFTACEEHDSSGGGEPVFSEFERYRVYSALGQHAHRIQRLSLDLGELDHPFVRCSESLTPLFLHTSPFLEDLSLTWHPIEWLPKAGNGFIRHPTEPIVVPLHRIPRLRRLRLENIVPAIWRCVAAPTLETFDVRAAIHDPFLLSGILYHCPLVTSFTLLSTGLHITHFSDNGVPPTLAANLQTVHIGAPFLSAWAVLRAAADMAAIRDVTITISGDERGINTGLVYDKLLQHIGAVVECSLIRSDPDADPTRPGQDVYSVFDGSGRSRRVIVSNSMNCFISLFWQAILASAGGIKDLRSVTVSHFMWYTTSFFLTIQLTPIPITNLRIILPVSSSGLSQLIELVQKARPGRFTYPRVTHIVFEADKDLDEYIPIVLDVLNSILRDDNTRPAEICVPFEGKTAQWSTILGPMLNHSKDWVVCSHCTRAI